MEHVLWIGGGTGAGKTTVADAVARRHDLQTYHYDFHDARDHSERIDPRRHPAMQRWHSMSIDERWVFATPADLARVTLDMSRERFEMVLDDLLALPADVLIVAEGFGFYPELLDPLLPNVRNALWLLPSASFRETALGSRGWSAPEGTSDPVRARRNKLDRDVLLTEYSRATAAERGYKAIEVDVGRTLESVLDEVERHFAIVLHGSAARRTASDPSRDAATRAGIRAAFPTFLAACTRGHSVLERVAALCGIEAYQLGLLHSAYMTSGRARVREDALRASDRGRNSRVGAVHWVPLVEARLAAQDGDGWLITSQGLETLRGLHEEIRAEIAMRTVPPALAGRVGEVLERMTYVTPLSDRARRIRELWGDAPGSTLARLYRAVWELYVSPEQDQPDRWPAGSRLHALKDDFENLTASAQSDRAHD